MHACNCSASVDVGMLEDSLCPLFVLTGRVVAGLFVIIAQDNAATRWDYTAGQPYDNTYMESLKLK